MIGIDSCAPRSGWASRRSCGLREPASRSACASSGSPAASRCCAPTSSDLVAELSILEGIEDLALTTNGVLLAQHAAELKGNGLHRVTVSLDTLDAGRVLDA